MIDVSVSESECACVIIGLHFHVRRECGRAAKTFFFSFLIVDELISVTTL